jgi:hypothetical protein
MVFRSDSRHAILLIMAGSLFLVVGLSGVVATAHAGWDVAWFPWLWTGFSLFMTFAFVDLVYRHYVVHERELVLNAALGSQRIRILWDDVERWLVWPGDGAPGTAAAWKLLYPEGNWSASMENRGILLRVRKRWWPVYISQGEVALPSYDLFLHEIRRAVGDREIRIGDHSTPPDIVGREEIEAIQAASATGVRAKQ